MADKPDFSELDKLRSIEELTSHQTTVRHELSDLNTEYAGLPFPDDAREKFAGLKDTDGEIERRVTELNARKTMLERMAGDERKVERVGDDFFARKPSSREVDIFDTGSIRPDSPERMGQEYRDRAMRAVEITTFPHPRAEQDNVRSHIAHLLDTADSEDKYLARRILHTGSPTYRRAFGKTLAGVPVSPEEQRALSQTGASGGFAVTFDLDPTIVPTSNGAVNPFRRVCRVVSTSTNEWRGVSSGAVVAQYRAEVAATTDNAPTLAQPAFLPKRADAFIPFSIEIGQDWGGLQSEMAKLIQDGKDLLEATQFAIGVGTTVFPQGIVVGATNAATTGTTTVLAVNDIYKTEEALPPRFRPNAQWFANRFIYNKVRQLDTAGGANLWVQDLRQGLAANETGNTGYTLLGYPANEASAMAATLATTTKLAVLGDPNYYVVVDRIGLNIELIPHMFDATTSFPTGQRGLFAMWRNTARVFDPAGFITLTGL
ncbi:MAG: phage major capsid protein [Candidatus Limnocylindria bacterium]